MTGEWIQRIRDTITPVKLNYSYVSPLEELAVGLQIGLKAPPTISCWRINSAPLLSRNGLCFHFAKRAKESSLRRSETPRPVSPAAKALSAVNRELDRCWSAGLAAGSRRHEGNAFGLIMLPACPQGGEKIDLNPSGFVPHALPSPTPRLNPGSTRRWLFRIAAVKMG